MDVPQREPSPALVILTPPELPIVKSTPPTVPYRRRRSKLPRTSSKRFARKSQREPTPPPSPSQKGESVEKSPSPRTYLESSQLCPPPQQAIILRLPSPEPSDDDNLTLSLAFITKPILARETIELSDDSAAHILSSLSLEGEQDSK